jgi:preprotein translocase subunit SecE
MAGLGHDRACAKPFNRRSLKNGTMAKISPFKFLQEVRAETEKVTWPTRRETMITTAMVFVMVTVASIFFLLADQVIRFGVTFILGIGR